MQKHREDFVGRWGSALWKRVRKFHANEVGAVGDQPDPATAVADPPPPNVKAIEAKAAEELKRRQAAERQMNAMLEHAGAKNADEFLGRHFSPPEPPAAKPGRQPASEVEWTPDDGKPVMPDESDFDTDSYGQLTPEGRKAYRSAMEAFTINCGEWATYKKSQAENEANFETALAEQIAALPEKWRTAPDGSDLGFEPSEALKDLVGAHAYATCKGEHPTATEVRAARETVVRLAKHISSQELTAADSEAAAARAGLPPEIPGGAPGGKPPASSDTGPPPDWDNTEKAVDWMVRHKG